MIGVDPEKAQSTTRRLMPWLNLLLVVILLAIGIWYLADKVSLAAILEALRLARPLPIISWAGDHADTGPGQGVALAVDVCGPGPRPSFAEAFWALMLGQYVNLIVPFLRLGEIARIYALNRQTNVPMASRSEPWWWRRYWICSCWV